jgi:hypothetical protein
MDARSAVAILLTLTVCATILSPVLMRVLGKTNATMSEAAVNSLTDLLKVALGAIVGWLASQAPR